MHACQELVIEWIRSYRAVQVVMWEGAGLGRMKVVIEFDDINVFGATEGKFRRGWGRCGCNVEVSENRKVIRYSDKRL